MEDAALTNAKVLDRIRRSLRHGAIDAGRGVVQRPLFLVRRTHVTDHRGHEGEGNMSTKIQFDNRACGDTKRFLDIAAVWRKLVAAPFRRGANTVCTMCRMCRILHIDSHGKTRTISTFVQKNTCFPYYQRKRRKEVRRTRKGWSDFVYRAQPLFSPEKRIRETQFSLFVAATGQPGRTTP